jgi:hypothetical protein
VPGTFPEGRLREVAASSLFIASGLYVLRPDGDLGYEGVRPGVGWHRHGHFPRKRWMLDQGRLVRRRLWKQRWLDPETDSTCHSRPPDEAGALWSCTLIIALKLWAWLDGGGLLTSRDVIEELEGQPSTRTVQRWLGRALEHSLELLHYIRIAVIERSEPRPVEHLFPSGLSPPEQLRRRRWRRPVEIAHLWRAFAWLFGGAIALSLPASVLLAEARGRKSATETGRCM